jgi:hypothetical protein
VLGEEREGIEILIACELFGLAHTGGKVLPGNNCFDCSEWIAALLPCGEQCATNFCIKPHLVVNRFALLSECPLILVFRLGEKAADEPVV